MKRNSIKGKRHIWLTTLLAMYFLMMAIVFGKDMLGAGKTIPFWAIVAAETAVLTGLFFALRHKEKLRREREERARDRKTEDK